MVRKALPLVVLVMVCGLISPAADMTFIRGDGNQDYAIDIADAVFTLNHLFGGGIRPSCMDSADANDDGDVDISDAITLLSRLFGGAGPLPPPHEACGQDPTDDALTCDAYDPCQGGLFTGTLTLPGGVTLEMIYCPPGTFMMGRNPGEQDIDPVEDPQHAVTLAKGFWLGKYVVTKQQWQAVMGTSPWAELGEPFVLEDDNSPAVNVTWDDAQACIAAVNTLAKGTFRLPTEAEWEYACRAGTATRFYWGDDPDYSEIEDYAWYKKNSYDVWKRYADVVGLKFPNDWGFFDMSGNVWEWCQDWYGPDYYSVSPSTDPCGPFEGSERMRRGGSCFYDAWYCRSAFRNCSGPIGLFHLIGFRLARVGP